MNEIIEIDGVAFVACQLSNGHHVLAKVEIETVVPDGCDVVAYLVEEYEDACL